MTNRGRRSSATYTAPTRNRREAEAIAVLARVAADPRVTAMLVLVLRPARQR